MCDHERLRTVGDRVFCCVCGKELPLDFLMNKGKPSEPPAADPGQNETVQNVTPEPVTPETITYSCGKEQDRCCYAAFE